MPGCVDLHHYIWQCMSWVVWVEWTHRGQWEYWQMTVCNPCKIHVLLHESCNGFWGEDCAGAIRRRNWGNRDKEYREEKERGREKESREKVNLTSEERRRKSENDPCGHSKHWVKPKPVCRNTITQGEIDRPYATKFELYYKLKCLTSNLLNLANRTKVWRNKLFLLLLLSCPENRHTHTDLGSLKELCLCHGNFIVAHRAVEKLESGPNDRKSI